MYAGLCKNQPRVYIQMTIHEVDLNRDLHTASYRKVPNIYHNKFENGLVYIYTQEVYFIRNRSVWKFSSTQEQG